MWHTIWPVQILTHQLHISQSYTLNPTLHTQINHREIVTFFCSSYNSKNEQKLQILQEINRFSKKKNQFFAIFSFLFNISSPLIKNTAKNLANPQPSHMQETLQRLAALYMQYFAKLFVKCKINYIYDIASKTTKRFKM